MSILIGYLLSYGFVLAVFILSFILQKANLVKEEGARKIIHILVCFTWVIMEKTFQGIHKVIVPATFVLVNLLSVKKHIIPGMERQDDNSFGTVFYAVSLSAMNLFACIDSDFIIPAGIGIFALSFGDGFAAIFGKINYNINFKIKQNKSFFGTLACFIFSFIGISIISCFMKADLSVSAILILSVVSMALEFVGGKYDNLIIPIGVCLTALVMIK